ncbi:MAG: hypothetical protein AMXMBFR67_33830 [Nitrospira sp.]
MVWGYHFSVGGLGNADGSEEVREAVALKDQDTLGDKTEAVLNAGADPGQDLCRGRFLQDGGRGAMAWTFG